MMEQFVSRGLPAHFDGNYTLEILVWATSFVPLYGIWEQFDENHDFDQIDGNYTLEKGGSVGPLECKFMALLKITNLWSNLLAWGYQHNFLNLAWLPLVR